MRIKGSGVLAIGSIVVLALLFLILVGACRSSESAYYPRDTTHGYYDTQHHYHYYPKYQKGSKSYVAPSKPKSNGWSFKKSGGSKGFSGGSKRR